MSVRPIKQTAFLALCAVAALALPSVVSAQPFPDETIQGTVLNWTDRDTLRLHDDRGYTDVVAVGEQAVVHPGRDGLAPGARVTIKGYNGGHWFVARNVEIIAAAPPGAMPPGAMSQPGDAPTDGAPPQDAYGAPAPYAVPPYPAYPVSPYPYPYYGYYGYPYGYGYYGYPYPYYGYPYAYGPRVRVNIGVGFWFGGGRWHR